MFFSLLNTPVTLAELKSYLFTYLLTSVRNIMGAKRPGRNIQGQMGETYINQYVAVNK